MTHKVSIIMPAYNVSGTISESIESVLKQTYKNWELVIVNDCSKDDTLQVIAPFIQAEPKIKLVDLTKNVGLPAARNAGVENAIGEFIAFLDSDDLWSPEKLKSQINFHIKNPDCAISHTDFEAFNQNGKVKRPLKKILESNKLKRGVLLPTLYYKNLIGVLTVMMKKNLFWEVGGFDASLWTLEDHDLWIRIAEKGYQYGYLRNVLASYRISPNGISKTLGKYKKAQKTFAEKHVLKIQKSKPVADKTKGNYYRHFGTAYFKKGEHKIAHLYFLKSLRLHGVSIISITTIIYMCYNYLKKIK